jgi:hypothetical protein
MSAAISRAQIERAITAMESTGHPVKGILLSPDGCVSLLTEAPAGVLASNDADGDWLSLAGETEVPRAQGA